MEFWFVCGFYVLLKSMFDGIFSNLIDGYLIVWC